MVRPLSINSFIPSASAIRHASLTKSFGFRKSGSERECSAHARGAGYKRENEKEKPGTKNGSGRCSAE
jgi:hypothetical protein